MARSANGSMLTSSSDSPHDYRSFRASQLVTHDETPEAHMARDRGRTAAPEERPTCFSQTSNFDQGHNGYQQHVGKYDPAAKRPGRNAEDPIQVIPLTSDPVRGKIHFLPLRKRGQAPLAAFDRELLALLPRLRRFARALARNASDADDLLQVALERALKARNQWQPGTRLDSWTMRIVRNCWIDEARSRVRRARTFAPQDEIDTLGSDAQRDIERYVEVQQVDRAMNTLPREQREAIALVLVEGLAYREAAEMLRIPMGTLTSRVTRGRHALVQMLEVA